MERRLLDEKEALWISYLKYNLKKYGGCFLLRCNYDVNDLDSSLRKFYYSFLDGGRILDAPFLMWIILKK